MSLGFPVSANIPDLDEDVLEEVNEAPIRHNVYPNTDSEEDEDEEEAEDLTHEFARPSNFGEAMLVVGQVFYDSEDIKAVVLDHALTHGRNVRQTRYDKNKIKFCCYGGNCSWRVWCAIRNHGDVVEKRPKTWCRAFHAIGSCCEDVTNNSTESFNATIMKARELPLVPLLELISRQAMVRIVTRSVIALNHTGICTPYATDLLADAYPKAAECTVWPGTNQTFLMQAPDCSYTVSLPRRACSCRKWDIRGIPCEHAYAVMIEKNLQVEDYVAKWFWKTTWIQTYEDGITPNRGAKFWPSTGCPDLHRPPSPILPGRKKKTVAKKQHRKKAVNESPTKKASKVRKRKMHCGICKQSGHNSKGHRKRFLASQSQGDGSQALPPLSQGECSQSQGDGSLSQSQGDGSLMHLFFGNLQ